MKCRTEAFRRGEGGREGRLAEGRGVGLYQQKYLYSKSKWVGLVTLAFSFPFLFCVSNCKAKNKATFDRSILNLLMQEEPSFV
jgi:hypothetical protein